MTKVAAIFVFITASWLALAPNVYGHKPSDSYLNLQLGPERFQGHWSVALRDLEIVLGLDSNSDRMITWNEIQSRESDIFQLAGESLSLHSGDPVPLRFSDILIDRLSDGAYAVLAFESPTSPSDTAIFSYDFLFGIDAQHRGIMTVSRHGAVPNIFIFTPENKRFELKSDSYSASYSFIALVREGVWHIWKGFDHLLFLFALLLPAVARFKGKECEVEPRFAPVLLEVAKVVTAFTIAHSVTLTLAALGVVSLPSMLVESVIAASVVFAAANNFYPMFSGRSWMIAFIFGLVHGFGFANVFADLGLEGARIIGPLFAFNVGVELGQLAVVALFLPLAFGIRRTSFYHVGILRYGSAAIAIVAATWMFERIFDLKVLPF